MKPISSAITSSVKQAQKVENSTGLQLGGNGSATPSNGALSDMHPALVVRPPMDNTAGLQLRLQQLGVNLSVKTSLIFHTDRQGETTSWSDKVTGVDLQLEPSANLHEARILAAQAMAPASVREIEHWLGELSVITVRRNESEAEAQIALSAYSKRLRDYPGDIVRDTLLGWTGKWFPAWAELKDVLDVRTAPRALIQTSLSIHSAVKGPPERTKPDLTGLSPDEQHSKLMFEARFARRSDPDWAKELEDQAVKVLADARKKEKQEH